MRLERISVALRPRTPLEAMDLGMVMLRAHAQAVWGAWLGFTLPVFLICQLIAWLLGMPWLGLLLPWWLRPLFDRIPLYVLSRAVFEQPPTWREALRSQWRWPWMRTLAMLSWLRVDTHRTLRLPMELLEGVTSQQRRARWHVLRKPLAGVTSGLTWSCMIFELVLFFSLCLFALWLLPGALLPDSMRDFNQALTLPAFKHTVVWIASGVAYVAMSAVEPLYVAAGFALYLNRRTQLEAWDIDLAFRRLRQRLTSAGVVLALLACLGGYPCVAHATDAHSAAAAPASQNIADVFHQPVSDRDTVFANEAMHVYRDPLFGQTHKVSRWAPRVPVNLSNRTPMPMSWFAVMFAKLGSGVLNLLMWVGLAVLLVALLVFAWRILRTKASSRESVPRFRALNRHTHQEQQALPDNLSAATRALWRDGHRREALALLYRGSVQHAATALRIQPSIDATEADWLRHASEIEDAARRERLVAIVRTWQFAAYADRYPTDAALDTLLSGWPAQQVAS